MQISHVGASGKEIGYDQHQVRVWEENKVSIAQVFLSRHRRHSSSSLLLIINDEKQAVIFVIFFSSICLMKMKVQTFWTLSEMFYAMHQMQMPSRQGYSGKLWELLL